MPQADPYEVNVVPFYFAFDWQAQASYSGGV